MGRENGVIYALGFFDGVHKGHQAILGEARKLAARRGLRAGVFTYENHPQAVVGGGAPPLLTTAAERRQIFAAQGMEEIVMTPFDRGFASQSPEEFIETLIGRYRCAGLCCGENFHFGARAAGDSRLLERLCVQKGLASRTAPPVTEGGRTVSSTLIRTLLRQGPRIEWDKITTRRLAEDGVIRPENADRVAEMMVRAQETFIYDLTVHPDRDPEAQNEAFMKLFDYMIAVS